MRIGTKSVLFGVHQFVLHPIIVAWSWWVIYREWPRLHEWAAIITHDLGYWGSPNMDGPEGENHPEIVAAWWRGRFGSFGYLVAREILGHSRYHAGKNNIPLSRLFQPDKLSTAMYPKWLYLLLGTLSGEIDEYMGLCKNGKYANVIKVAKTKRQWLIETQAHMALMGLHGERYRQVLYPKAQRDEISKLVQRLADIEKERNKQIMNAYFEGWSERFNGYDNRIKDWGDSEAKKALSNSKDKDECQYADCYDFTACKKKAGITDRPDCWKALY